MGDKEKHLCKFKDHIKDELELYKRLVKEPRYVCLKCGRAAHEEKHLCKPAAID